MTWEVWQWTFELESAAHVGFHKVMHLYRTRPYVPGRNLWAALVARVTQLTGTRDYARIGDQIHQSMRFRYLYVCEGDRILVPCLCTDGWNYGNIPRWVFERRYVNAITSTAIDASSLTAEDESLHQLEVLSPWWEESGQQKKTMVTGIFWVRAEGEAGSGGGVIIDDQRLWIVVGSSKWPLDEVANGLQVGGERRYGLGKLRLKGTIVKLPEGLGPFEGRAKNEEGNVPQVEMEAGNFIWAHAEAAGSNCEGDIEAVVGRDWDADKGAGRRLRPGALYWLPGSVLKGPATFDVDPMGFWKPAKNNL